ERAARRVRVVFLDGAVGLDQAHFQLAPLAPIGREGTKATPNVSQALPDRLAVRVARGPEGVTEHLGLRVLCDLTGLLDARPDSLGLGRAGKTQAPQGLPGK